MTVRAIKPIEISSAMVVASTLFETAPATYNAGTTYALGAYASVAGLLGEIFIYKSLQAGNINHTPASSPTWWFLSSKTYELYNATKFYDLNHRVINPTTHKVMQSLVQKNVSQDINGMAAWMAIGKTTLALPATYNSGTTYITGDLVKTSTAIGAAFINAEGFYIESIVTTVRVYASRVNANIGNTPSSSPTQWELLKSYPLPYELTGNYMLGFVVKDVNGDMYQSLKDDNYNTPLIAPAAWLEVAPSNSTAFLDGEVSTQSVANGDMEFTIATGVIDTLALVGIQGGTATVTVRDGLGGTIGFEQTQGVSGEIVADWYAFTYGDAAIPLRKVVFTELPPYVNAHVTIKIVGDGEVKLGAVVAGVQADIGIGASYGANIEVKDYSVKTTDDFGKTKFVKRGYKEVLEISVLLDKTSFNRTHNTLINLRSQPWFLIVSDDPDLSEALYMYGFYNSYRNVIEYPTATIYSLQFESLVS